jgi:16S rRNA (guanine527-N7)-methyltransferase
LLAVGGEVLALKGESARAEVATAAQVVARLGGGPAQVVRCGVGVVDPPTTVVRIRKVRSARERGRSRR